MTSSAETRKTTPPIWLFRKQLNGADVTVALGQLVVGECCEEMKMVLARLIREGKSTYLRVRATDPNGRAYELRLIRFNAIQTHILYHKWGSVVVANGLNKGDTIEGWGNIVDGGAEVYVTCTLYFRRQKPESSSSRKRNSPGNQDPGNKRGGDGVEKSKSLGGNKKIRTREEEEVTSSERNGGSSPANQESEQVYVDITGDGDDGKKPEPILEGENPAESSGEGKYSASSENRETVDGAVEKSKSVGGSENIETAREEAAVISSERNGLNSSPAIQESEEVHEEEIVEGENPQKKRAVTDHMHVRVSIKDPNNKVFQLKLTRYVPQGSNYALCDGWEKVATENDDDDDAEKQNFEEAMEIKESDDDVNSNVGQLLKKIVEREQRKKGYESFVWFRAEDKKGVECELRLSSEENGVGHQWREVVAANGLKTDDGVEFLLKMVRFG